MVLSFTPVGGKDKCTLSASFGHRKNGRGHRFPGSVPFYFLPASLPPPSPEVPHLAHRPQ
eukprot:851026-Rhodomonas_salina.1